MPSTYRGWQQCYELSNEEVRLVVLADVGPRIIHFGFTDGENVLYVDDETAGQTGGPEWLPYGGHRLWHAPEMMPRTYYPDNDAVTVDTLDDGVRATAGVEAATGIQKALEVVVSGHGVHLTHRLTNRGPWPITLAPWALTIMAPGGVAIAPLPPRGTHDEQLQPNTSLTLWAYTDMSDPRWAWGRTTLMLRQDPSADTPQKVGLSAVDGWLAYSVKGMLFVKTFEVEAGAAYPDMGSSAEIFTNSDMLELESLGPLVTLEPGHHIEHREAWHLFRDVPRPETEADVISTVLPLAHLAKEQS